MYSVCGIEIRTAILLVIRGHAPHTFQHPWRGTRLRIVPMNVKGALPRQVWHTRLGHSNRHAPTTDPETSSSIIRQGVRGPAGKGSPWTPPTTTKHPAASTGSSGPCRTAVWQHPLTVTTASYGTESAQTRSHESLVRQGLIPNWASPTCRK